MVMFQTRAANSSIVYGYQRIFPYEGTSAKSPKIRSQNSSTILRAQFYERKTRNSIFWKFLGNHMMEISWKLYAGKFLETICWEIRVDTSSFLMRVIMAQCYGIS